MWLMNMLTPIGISYATIVHVLVRVCGFRLFFTQVMRIYVNVYKEYGQNIKHRA